MKKKLGIIGGLKGQYLKQQLEKRGIEDVGYEGLEIGRFKMYKFLASFEKVIVIADKDYIKNKLSLLCMVNKLAKAEIIINICGGFDLSLTEKQIKHINSFKNIIFETVADAKTVEDGGVLNCGVVPNFKDTNPRDAMQFPTKDGESRFVVFAGMEVLVSEALEKYNATHSDKAVLEVTDGKDVSKITDSIAMIYPVEDKSMGTPLEIIEAYGAALPVISGKWKGADEIIRPFETGLIYPNNDGEELSDIIAYAMEHKAEFVGMRKNCKLLATRYSANYVVPRIIENYLK